MAKKTGDGVLLILGLLVVVITFLWEAFGWWLLLPVAVFGLLIVLGVWGAEKPDTGRQSQQTEEEYRADLHQWLNEKIREGYEEEINAHQLRKPLTKKEEFLMCLAFESKIRLPLNLFFQQKIDQADQVFLTMVREGYFQAAEPYAVVDNSLTVEQIKQIFREHDLPLSGRKAELLDRLFAQLPEIAAEIVNENGFYTPTEKARTLGIYLDEKERSHSMEFIKLLNQRNYYVMQHAVNCNPDAYGLEFRPVSTFCRHSQQLAGICPRDNLPDTWPPEECEHPYHACNCLFDIVYSNDERLKQPS
ncbi:SAP domain-containing protein [Neisseria leonii]|uniref:SAP domain-containing protein n=1 Tax=Neisseria leonii TaxID=2995413 RepID=A0A9X4E1Z2_9NEIS|nr:MULTISPECIES: SAP domain-containing protein [unclassified Neisseria]MDD9324748.1 SAP domain-containing protein [Neisseria sp. 3986]MDD9327689.1 SAP domain-containing protein [Neisseria sp. 51.81]